jgi:hypothetical protein
MKKIMVAFGKNMANAISTAKIAPEAPMIGLSGVNRQQNIPAKIPAVKYIVRNFLVPIALSTSLPNIHSTSILNIICHGLSTL